MDDVPSKIDQLFYFRGYDNNNDKVLDLLTVIQPTVLM
jgi:hypothetical protein